MGDFVIQGTKFQISRMLVGGPPAPTWADFNQVEATWYELTTTNPQAIPSIAATRIDNNHALLAYHFSNFGDLRVSVVNVAGNGVISTVTEVDVTQSALGNRTQNLAISPLGGSKYLITGHTFSGSNRVRGVIVEATTTSITVGNSFNMTDLPDGGAQYITMLDGQFGIQAYQLDFFSGDQVPHADSFELAGSPISSRIVRMNAEALTSASIQFTPPTQQPIAVNDRAAVITIRDSVSGGVDPVFTGLAFVKINDDGSRRYVTSREVLNLNTTFWESVLLNTDSSGSPETYHIGGLADKGNTFTTNRFVATHNTVRNGTFTIGATTSAQFNRADTINTSSNMGHLFSPSDEDWTMLSLTVDTGGGSNPLRVGVWEFDPSTKVPTFIREQAITDTNGGQFRLTGGQATTTVVELSTGRLLVVTQGDDANNPQPADNFVCAAMLEL